MSQMPPHIVKQITQAGLLAGAIAFFILELRLSSLDRQLAARSVFSLAVELVQEDDQRWIAEVPGLPGVAAYGSTPAEARTKAQALALRVVADRLEQGEADPDILAISFSAV